MYKNGVLDMLLDYSPLPLNRFQGPVPLATRSRPAPHWHRNSAAKPVQSLASDTGVGRSRTARHARFDAHIVADAAVQSAPPPATVDACLQQSSPTAGTGIQTAPAPEKPVERDFSQLESLYGYLLEEADLAAEAGGFLVDPLHLALPHPPHHL